MRAQDIFLRHLTIAFQPIYHLSRGHRIGWEALLRGPGGRPIPVLAWLDRAAREGWLGDLARRAWELARRHAADVLAPDEVLFVNWDQRAPLPDHLPWPQTVVELSERLPLPPDVVARIHDLGARVAMDDFGQGVTSLRALGSPGVDVIKLDVTVTHGIDRDPARQVLLRGLNDLCLALAPDLWILAEGIETEGERAALIGCGIAFGQGFALGMPQLAPRFRTLPQAAPPSEPAAGGALPGAHDHA
ncbi:MAG: EAL domain-containing protein [Firmicutes bacterium]|nr:EAL domain-containing protein [Bacillota bacterium]